MAAASAPVKLGTSARLVSDMLTSIEPEKVGPNTANEPSSTALLARPLATPGFDWVSLTLVSIFLPRMPPAALISLTASSTPFLKLVPAVAPAPDSSCSTAILMVCCAWAVAAPNIKAALAALASRWRRSKVMACLLGVVRTAAGSRRHEQRAHVTGVGLHRSSDVVEAEEAQVLGNLLNHHLEARVRDDAARMAGSQQRRRLV